jgi:hypothetical protein
MAERGRPSIFTEELAARICERLAAGETLRSVCRDDEMPSRETIRNWKREKPEFLDQYTRARADGYEDWADELLEIVDDKSGDAARDRLRFDGRRWLLSKALPKVYGDKLAHTGADGEGPVALAITWQPPSE